MGYRYYNFGVRLRKVATVAGKAAVRAIAQFVEQCLPTKRAAQRRDPWIE